MRGTLGRDVTELAAFLGVAVVVIVTPGPDTALTIRNTLLGGRRGGVLTAAGVALGQATWTLATAAGAAALLASSERLFTTLKLAGAAYLVWLGAQALADAARGHRLDIVGETRLAARRPTGVIALRQGLVSNLTNPKMAAFFPALLPQFAPAGEGAFFALLGLGVAFAAMTLAWLAVYAVAVAKAGAVLRRPQIRRALAAVTGAVLVAFGLRIATAER